MSRQITQAIVAVAVLIVVGLGIPLAMVVQRFYEDQAIAILQRRAAQTVAELSVPLDRAALAKVAAEPDAPRDFTVYDAAGHRLFGTGPRAPEPVVRRALDGTTSRGEHQRDLVLASPITDRSNETVAGAVRVAEPRSIVDRRVERAWFVMAVAIGIALAGAAALARAQARHLAAPVARLADQAVRLGDGDFSATLDVSGIAEVDTVAAALHDSAARLAALLARERSFSADVSHQLRTPLTSLRLRLERASRGDQDPSTIPGALEEIDRLEITVAHLLALSRDRLPVGAPLQVDELLAGVTARWRPRLAAEHRELVVEPSDRNVPVSASNESIGQALDILIDNGLRHGAGTVTVRARAAVGGLVIEVADEGVGVADERRAAVFDRHEGAGHGIGLALARSLTEAEGGRLLLASGTPPCFQVVLPSTE